MFSPCAQNEKKKKNKKTVQYRKMSVFSDTSKCDLLRIFDRKYLEEKRK